MKNIKITRVSCEDWTGFYFDNKLACEGHSISAEDILQTLGYKSEPSIYFEDENDLDKFGNRLPDTLSELQDYIKK